MNIYYLHNRFVHGNVYMTTGGTPPVYSEGVELLKSKGMLNANELALAIELLAATPGVGGSYPNVYVCSYINTDNGVNYHLCINPDGKIVQINAVKLFAHYPTSLYDGSKFDNGFVRGIYNESYDYGFNHTHERISSNVKLQFNSDETAVFYNGHKLTLNFNKQELTLDSPFKKSELSSDMLRRLNSLIHCLLNKQHHMLVEVSETYELLKV